ncbi:PDZ domain-containing protein [Rathayibacter soli]|uniref:PDZ domain-containing protein n=1 Tax=Rathayibacter soli TaxID=3144168 RepID=UPI0027E4ACBA|nr:PDZ domain-containing protein [Glaciibacter superstes]
MITTIDGRSATRADVLTAVTLTKKAGDPITVGYVRDGADKTTTVTLGAIPQG